jgi:Regulator of volume decrease after cellular swelling
MSSSKRSRVSGADGESFSVTTGFPLLRIFSPLPASEVTSTRTLNLSPSEAIRAHLTAVSAFHGDSLIGQGDLYVTTTRIAFLPAASQAISIDYPRITLHAICRDPVSTANQNPCIYCQVTPLRNIDERADSEDIEGYTEDIYFAPQKGTDLDSLFAAITACAEIFPDVEGGVMDEDGPLPPWFAALAEGNSGGGGQFDNASSS